MWILVSLVFFVLLFGWFCMKNSRYPLLYEWREGIEYEVIHDEDQLVEVKVKI
jgi:hypothetical protein